MAEEMGIIFVPDSAEELETDDEQDGADAAGGEHGIVADVP